ncbi:MAG: archaeal proteasome endopeptidase complex subunit alpha [Cenarchaeum sp. SB0665_bin_23]|nr:archaeal proteasome endopeptidase complex subunit alpha [Cenarchaeum sp. SB0667_bin_13]MXY37940.1 archaeal proteasome endopeptidase complex subunit alpha [Cenarchaeum sp. SB0664_bin_35]MXY61436.1 archaeal proteasome endopeptidase complex subunit alpha [Cenarchaeum sp. SB0665_bin_23]MXZ94139.1 archaeal proteasome endopeptidase complex subunit alpha [Cenarchaeum sp. SB0666_bin_15]MYB46191.1 archaeal proteasome endopeptidase complex subunit alpha [Cenarchaeum sp. SB0662_bin_33]MYC79280.1 archa
MLPAQQGYDRAITVFSPDGRLYQVEYAIETVRRGSVAVGIKFKDGVVIAGEERTRKLQITESAQKLFKIDDHIGVAAAGYIPDARSQVDNARFFSQSNQLIYDEVVDIATVAKHLADQCQQFTQYAGVRPFGVALILGGLNKDGPHVYLTDPSGTYIEYDAIAIGAGSDRVTSFLEKSYKPDLVRDDAAALAVASVKVASDSKNVVEQMRIAIIDKGGYREIDTEEIAKYAEQADATYSNSD